MLNIQVDKRDGDSSLMQLKEEVSDVNIVGTFIMWNNLHHLESITMVTISLHSNLNPLIV